MWLLMLRLYDSQDYSFEVHSYRGPHAPKFPYSCSRDALDHVASDINTLVLLLLDKVLILKQTEMCQTQKPTESKSNMRLGKHDRKNHNITEH